MKRLTTYTVAHLLGHYEQDDIIAHHEPEWDVVFIKPTNLFAFHQGLRKPEHNATLQHIVACGHANVIPREKGVARENYLSLVRLNSSTPNDEHYAEFNERYPWVAKELAVRSFVTKHRWARLDEAECLKHLVLGVAAKQTILFGASATPMPLTTLLDVGTHLDQDEDCRANIQAEVERGEAGGLLDQLALAAARAYYTSRQDADQP